MTPKQRFEAAMNFKKPEDFVAFMEIEFHIYREYLGKTTIVGQDFVKLSPKEREKAHYINAEILVEMAEKAGHDAIKDIGGYWEISPGEPAYQWMPDIESRVEHMKALKKVAGDKFFLLCSNGCPLGIPDGNHINDYVIDLYENPDLIKEQSEKATNGAIFVQNKLLEAGADGVLNACDVAFNSGPFISPDKMDEFFFPYFNRWAEECNKNGIISIFHTDGNIMPIMDRILESGVRAIQCIDPLGGMDIVELKKQVNGRLALVGNINCSNLQMGSKEEIENEVKRVVEGCKGDGGFVLCGCNAIFKGIPADNYQVMVDARYKYGKE
jgi:uroporphyrinogen decarboxylase